MGIRWIKGLLCSIFLLLPPALAASQPSVDLVIVKSSDNAYFDQSVETLVNHLDPATRHRTVLAAEFADVIDDGYRDRLFVALGQSAVQAVMQLNDRADAINAYLTLEQYRDLGLDRQLTILLDQPPHRYLEFSRRLLSAKRIGVLVERDPAPGSARPLPANETGFELNQYPIDDKNKLLPQLRKLLRENDALLMLPRQSIYNRESLKGVLLTSYRSRKPVISYSPAHVKSGALASIYSSPVDIGRQLSQLVNRKLAMQPIPGSSFRYARYYSIATNQRVARALGLTLPEESELRAAIDRLEP